MTARADANLASLLAETAREHGARTALIAGDERISYAELDGWAAAFAQALHDGGIRPGDRVGILLPNVPGWVAAYYAIARLGAISVPLNVLLRDGEIEERLADAGATALVAAAERSPGGLPRFDPDFVLSQHKLDSAARPDPDLVLSHHKEGLAPFAAVEADTTAVILYTSGTTGRPKGAELTHGGLAMVAQTLGGLLELDADDVVFGAAPLAHVFGMSAAMNMTFAFGASVTLVERFEPTAALELIEREHVSVFLGVPTMCLMLLAASRETSRAPRLRVTHCGGAPMPVAALHDFVERFGGPVLEGYGLTETAGTVTSHRIGRPVKAGAVGEAIAGTEVRIAGGDSTDGEPAVGEVLVRGPGVMRGYWRNEAETRAALSDDGWLATGDVGFLDDDGYLTLVDRKKDVILRGGYNVYPREVEEVLYEHPAVEQAVVIGVDDPVLGEEVVAVVVARRPIEPGELKAYVRERVAAYKYPRLVVVVDELPVGPTGKVLRRAIDRAPLRTLLDES